MIVELQLSLFLEALELIRIYVPRDKAEEFERKVKNAPSND